MIKVLHVSTECYPAAKAGGMGDVVGALPAYSKAEQVIASVVIPRYDMPWFGKQKYINVYEGTFDMGGEQVAFAIQQEANSVLGFDFYVVSIPGKFDRPSVYLAPDGEGYRDEVQRNIAFQRAILLWLNQSPSSFDLIHCHDHQSGLIPFFMGHSTKFAALRDKPTFFTIHNSAYVGSFPWSMAELLAEFEGTDGGMLDWDGQIHSIAAAVKASWRYSTVSPSYLKEIQETSGSLSLLYRQEAPKALGILNGIDNTTWDPKTDPLLENKFSKGWEDFKQRNKAAFIEKFSCPQLDANTAWFGFIGRLAWQKGADILPEAIHLLAEKGQKAAFLILGSGNKTLEANLSQLERRFPDQVKVLIMYDEAVAHLIYAATDFLLMPSRFEPCGLNQLFAMRYGSLPIARATGGLIDTVVDVEAGGTGFSFQNCNASELAEAMERASKLFADKKTHAKTRQRAGRKNYSWSRSMKLYADEYKKMLKTSK